LTISVPKELYFLAQVAAIILLFLAGLETDLNQFLKYTYPSLAVAIGGVVLPFLFGVWTTILFGFGSSFLDPAPLFMGAVMTATSVGITARVLNKVRKTNTPEGVTILASAVVDDVLGILILGAVVTISTLGSFSIQDVIWVGGKSLLFLGILVAVGFLLDRYMDFFIRKFQTAGAGLVIPLGLCFIAAALAELFGLAMIIGAYIIGLALSASKISSHLEEQLSPVYQVFVPIFFVVMGMLVDFSALKGALIFGIAISLLAVLSKVLGAGLPSLLVGFNTRGGLRIGLGMLPRGEVALIIAGVGVSAGVIGQDVYGVAVMMTLFTTLIAPIFLLNALQKGGSGLNRKKMEEAAFHDVCVLEDPQKYRHQFQKSWNPKMGEEWRNYLLTVLSEKGLRRIRGIHGRECHLFTFEGEEGALFSVSEALDPETATVTTRVYSTEHDVMNYIEEADRLYNDSRAVRFLEDRS
jgi:Kef-type K+ transport system membrane component KefB